MPIFTFLQTYVSNIQGSLSLSDIEDTLFLLLSLRFIILAVRYNLKTSFYITCIGLAAGYLWYRHLIDLILMYRTSLLEIPFFEKFGMNMLQVKSYHYLGALNSDKLGDNIRWYNIGGLFYYAFIKGIITIDPETQASHYIDPVSMFISNMQETTQIKILPYYYKIYNQIIPRIFSLLTSTWRQIAGIAAYSLVTRIGKRYCPYLVRWHWTFLLILGLFEVPFQYIIARAEFFKNAVLLPKMTLSNGDSTSQQLEIALKTLKSYNVSIIDVTSKTYDQTLFQLNILNGILTFFVSLHMFIILFALFHAIFGQYFYFPFLTENAELHIGPRPKNSVYSGGFTAWQDPKEKETNNQKYLPKVWYGILGRGTLAGPNILLVFSQNMKKIVRRIKKKFPNL